MMWSVVLSLIPTVLCVQLQIPLGTLEGRLDKSFNQNQYYSFEGIPYAQAPIGKLRFVAPREIKPWKGVQNATYQRIFCPQIVHENDNSFDGLEDCLYLNVYTASVDPKKKAPVIVYFYAGGFKRGTPHQCTSTELFAESDVVMVTFSHRLGALGFLTLDTEEVPGNAGLRDALAVLKWVQNYIQYFGGDPDNVTLMGVSSGATIIDILRDARPAKGLFHKVICMSGGKPDVINRANGTRLNSRQFLNLLKISTVNNGTLAALQETPLKSILGAMFNLTLEGVPYNFSPFTPVYEISTNRSEAMYIDIEDEMQNCSIVNDIPTFIGHTSQDFFNADKHTLDSLMSTDDNYIVPFDWNVAPNKERELAGKIKRFYFKNRQYDMSSYRDYDRLFTLLSHDRIMVPMYNRILTISTCTNSHTYYYIFDYQGMRVPDLYFPFLAVMHGDEIFYMCPKELFRVDERSSDGWTRKRLVEMVCNFAKYGNPTPKISNVLPVTWKPFDKANEDYLHIGTDLYTSTRPMGRIVSYWNGLKSQYYQKKKTKIIPVWQMSPTIVQ